MREYQSCVYVWGSTDDDALGCRSDRHREAPPAGGGGGIVAGAAARVQRVPRRLAGCCTAILAGGGGGGGAGCGSGPGFPPPAMIVRVVASSSGGGGPPRTTAITDKLEAYAWGGRGGATAAAAAGGGVLRGGGRSGSSSSCTMERIRAGGVTSVAHGTGHTCAVTAGGEIYGWGSNAHGTLGVDPDGKIGADRGRSRPRNILGGRNGGAGGSRGGGIANPNPRRLDLGGDSSDVVAAACGEKHTCILRRDGTILTAGANDAGQLGIGSAGCEDRPEEKGKSGFSIIQGSVRRGIKTPVAFKELTCGSNHCAAISSDDASLYTWGWGQSGRLGTGDERGRDRPTYVAALSDLAPLATVACGSAHTLVATVDGDVYGFGWNAHGQVSGAAKGDNEGGASSDVCLLPVPCMKQKGVVALSSGGFHTAAITQNGDLYLWGKSQK
jgi:alpha-tubulin suppressor-like RCC1 family protein